HPGESPPLPHPRPPKHPGPDYPPRGPPSASPEAYRHNPPPGPDAPQYPAAPMDHDHNTYTPHHDPSIYHPGLTPPPHAYDPNHTGTADKTDPHDPGYNSAAIPSRYTDHIHSPPA